MQYQATKKIPGGKLVRVKIEAAPDETITQLEISGDFFLHPEEAISTLEKSLIGFSKKGPYEQLSGKIHEVLDSQHATFIGVTPEDIAEAILEADEAAQE